MKILLVIILMLSIAPAAYCGNDYKEDDRSNNESFTSTGAVTGGILIKGQGASIGSSSPNAGEGALKVGVDAATGSDFGRGGKGSRMKEAGIGTAGRTLVDTDWQRTEQDHAQEEEIQDYQRIPKNVPINTKIKRKIKRRYDDEGNMIQEEDLKTYR